MTQEMVLTNYISFRNPLDQRYSWLCKCKLEFSVFFFFGFTSNESHVFEASMNFFFLFAPHQLTTLKVLENRILSIISLCF